MGARKLGTAATIYASVFAAAGIAAGSYLILSSAPLTWELHPVVWLGLLAVAGPVLSVSRQGYLPSRIVHQIGSAFAYALFFLAPPGAACAVLWASALADWGLNRRRPIQAAFNLGQFGISILAATLVRQLLLPGFTVLADVSGTTVGVAAISLLVFFLVNQALTRGVMSLLSGRPIHRLRTLSGPALIVEALCIVSGIGMAVFWQMEPWLMLLGVIPIWAIMLLLSQLSHREQELERREEDLRALQDLGLQIGSELDAERVRQAVVRVATQALQVRGALLLASDSERQRLVVMAHEGIESPPPEAIRPQRFDESFLKSGAVRLIHDFPSERTLWPELEFLDAEGVLAAPLQILDRYSAVLVLFHGPERRRFDEGDVRRVQVLLRFVHVALSNAELVRELRDMQEHLAQAEKMSAMGMLVSGVAHELNNPLTTVLGYSQLLLEQENDAAKRRMLDRVLAEAERAGKIVHNLLTFSRKRKPERRLTHVAQILDQVLELREHELRIHDVQVVRRFARDLPPVLVDAHQFQQVFLNLLINAEDALKEARRRGRIVIETRDRGGWVQVVVSDDGPGIPPTQLKKVFLPFFTTKGVGRGTGLGLSICYGIVHEHGGRIDVESREGQGASFFVEIPTARHQSEAGALEPAIASPAPIQPSGGRLLVVDDDVAIADMVREALELEGWTVATAKDGGEALEVVADAEFDAILVDLRMPGMDGRTFFEHLRAGRPDLERCVVFATGDTGSEDAARFLEESGKTVLGKPYEIRELMEAISKIAGGSSQVH